MLGERPSDQVRELAGVVVLDDVGHGRPTSRNGSRVLTGTGKRVRAL